MATLHTNMKNLSLIAVVIVTLIAMSNFVLLSQMAAPALVAAAFTTTISITGGYIIGWAEGWVSRGEHDG